MVVIYQNSWRYYYISIPLCIHTHTHFAYKPFSLIMYCVLENVLFIFPKEQGNGKYSGKYIIDVFFYKIWITTWIIRGGFFFYFTLHGSIFLFDQIDRHLHLDNNNHTLGASLKSTFMVAGSLAFYKANSEHILKLLLLNKSNCNHLLIFIICSLLLLLLLWKHI